MEEQIVQNTQAHKYAQISALTHTYMQRRIIPALIQLVSFFKNPHKIHNFYFFPFSPFVLHSSLYYLFMPSFSSTGLLMSIEHTRTERISSNKPKTIGVIVVHLSNEEREREREKASSMLMYIIYSRNDGDLLK